MDTLNACFFPLFKQQKAVISSVFAHKDSFKNIIDQTALYHFMKWLSVKEDILIF